MTSLICGRFRLFFGLLASVFLISNVFADVSYTVKPGDTVSQLASRFSISIDEIVSLNALKNPNLIFVGQQLRLPDRVAPLLEAEQNREPSGTPVEPEKVSPPDSERTPSGRALLEERARLLATQRGEQIVTEARAYTGAPYRRGGLSARGIDCSGLVVRAMAAQGIKVPHSSAALFQLGTRVTYAELQPGDLVFFNTNGRGISHVGIWIGDHKFIHASSSGRGVVIDRMEGYYSRRLVGARRIH